MKEADRLERLALAILTAAGPELERRRRERSLVYQFVAWARPVLSAAAVLILIFGSVLVATGSGRSSPSQEAPLMAQLLVPDPLVFWLQAAVEPTLTEVVQALEEVGR